MGKLDEISNEMFKDALLFGQVDISSYIKKIESDTEFEDMMLNDFKNMMEEYLDNKQKNE